MMNSIAEFFQAYFGTMVLVLVIFLSFFFTIRSKIKGKGCGSCGKGCGKCAPKKEETLSIEPMEK